MNNGKVRIYELSRELDLDNKDVLTICERLAIPVKSHSSTVTESDAEKIRSTAAGAPKRSLQKPILKPKQKPTLAQPKTTRPIRKPQILEVKRPKSPPQNPVYARPQRPSASKAEAPPQDVPPLPEPPLYAESQTVESILPRHIPCIGRGYIEPALDLIPDVLPLRMVLIPSGTFTMGSPNDEPERYDREYPQRNVTVPPFFMGRYPITQAQWRAVAALDQVERPLQEAPSKFKGNNHPVENISWHDAVEFCHRLKQITDRPYRLPTEAEWEYACRAGTTTPFHYGKTLTDEIANYQATSTYADGPKGEYRQQTTPVDYFGIANAFGLSDMHGNVLEWCQDQWHKNYKSAPIDGSAWEDREEGASRILRGGSWGFIPRNCRSACRSFNVPDDRDDYIGFRVVCSAPRILP